MHVFPHTVTSTDLFKTTVEEVIVLVHKSTDRVGHVSSIVNQTKLVSLNSLSTLVVQLLVTAYSKVSTSINTSCARN